MPQCHDMHKGEVYVCSECGLELQVIRECRDVGKPASECGCHGDDEHACTITCCGQELVRKRA